MCTTPLLYLLSRPVELKQNEFACGGEKFVNLCGFLNKQQRNSLFQPKVYMYINNKAPLTDLWCVEVSVQLWDVRALCVFKYGVKIFA